MAEALLRHRLAERAPEVTVGSVGLRFDDRPAERHAVRAMARRGLDLDAFRSRIMTAELLADSSLVLGMERMHVREVAVLGPDLLDHTFTLPDLVALAERSGPRRDEDLRSWAVHLGGLRTAADNLGDDPASSVADPMGQSARRFRACAEELDDLIGRLVDLAWPRPVAVGAATTTDTEPPPHGGSR
jgi:protein-tyrosine phosphatase